MKNKTGILLGAALLLNLILGCVHGSTSSSGCDNHLRALLDIGLRTTELNLSEVATCGGQTHLVRVLDNQTSVEFLLQAGKDSDGALSQSAQELGVKILSQLRDQAVAKARDQAPQIHSVEIAAVGTNALRSITNASEFANKLKAAGIPLTILPQQREGEISYEGVHTKGVPTTCLSRDTVVWDIGGGNQQLTSPDHLGKLNVQSVGFSSENFKLRLMSHLSAHSHTKSCPAHEPSPNPIGWKNSSRAETLAQTQAETALGKNFQIHPFNQCVVGVGGVHNKSIAAQVIKYWPQLASCACEPQSKCAPNANLYSKKELQCLALWLSEKSDCDPEIKGAYSSSAVSDLFLVLGFMEQMKISEVATVDIDRTDELILGAGDLTWNTLKTF